MHPSGLSSEDAEAVQSWLLDRLETRDLRRILQHGGSTEHVNVVLQRLGEPRSRRTKQRLAREIVGTFGSQLLSDPFRRSVLVKRCVKGKRAQKKLTIARWHPGKGAARHFVAELELPEVLTGEPVHHPPAHEDIDAFPPLGELHSYQRQVQARMLRRLRRADPAQRRAIVWLPTGTGKTRVTVETLLLHLDFELPRNCILWIADREELCEQAASDFRHVWMQAGHQRAGTTPPLRIMRLWGQYGYADPPTIPTVIVASIQKLARGLDKEEFEERVNLLGKRSSVVVLDEAHKSGSPTYIKVLRALGMHREYNAFRRNHRSGPALFGLTATPVRGGDQENQRLKRRFASCLIEPNPGFRTLGAFVKAGFLSESIEKVVPTGYTLTQHRKDAAHWDKFRSFSPGVINRAGQDPARTAQIVKHLEKRLPDLQSVLVFACSVDHAHAMARVLAHRGIAAKALDGGTTRGVRQATIEAFRRRQFQVLVNCDLLATGFDAPNVDCVAIARPVGSRVLYAQMVGRGLRGVRNGGTERCLILDYEDSAGPYGDLDGLRQQFRQLWRRR